MDRFLGTWALQPDKDENVDEYFEKRGTPFMVRQAMKLPGTKRIYTANPDGTYSMEMKHPVKAMKHTFKLGEQFEASTPGGKTKMTVTTENGNILEKHILVDKNNQEEMVTVVRDGDVLHVTITSDGATCKRHFKKE